MRVDDAELPLIRFYQRTDIDAALTADKKVRRSQSEAVTVQKVRLTGREFKRAGRVRCAQGIVCSAKTTLAGPDRPVLRCNGGSIAETYGSAVTASLKF